MGIAVALVFILCLGVFGLIAAGDIFSERSVLRVPSPSSSTSRALPLCAIALTLEVSLCHLPHTFFNPIFPACLSSRSSPKACVLE